MTQPLRAVLYCRVSDVRGNKKRDDWDSIPRQRAALVDLARRHDMTVVDVLEEAMSGAKERPVFQRMLEMVREGEANAILVATFDRLTRTEQIGEFEQVKADLRRVGCRLFTVDMGHVPLDGKADSELWTDMRATVSKFERLKIRERTLAAREASAKAGKWTGHAAPFGYRVVFDPTTGERSFEIDPGQAAAVRRMFEVYLAGEGPKDIATWLQAEGFPAPRSGTWSKPAVRYMLRNSIYAGIAVFRKPINRPNDVKSGPIITATSTAFPPIVPLELWEKVQDEIAARKQHRRRHGPGTPHPLSGILRCNGCDGRMGFIHIGAGRYRCQTNDSYPGRCTAPTSYWAAQAHAQVLRFLKRELPRHLDRQRVLSLQAEDAGAAPEVDEAAPLRLRIAELERAREGIVMKIALGELERSEVDFTLRNLARDIEAAKGQVAAKERERSPAAVDRHLANMEHIIDALEGYNESDDDLELRELFESIVAQAHLVRNGRDPADRRRWNVRVAKLQLLEGTWIHSRKG
jgi:DNA invertase Pin-like site-specific DNA recombinase